jgi:16S rRNA A1518/A1519 N6-dimethyltransferase RsmA/KsgA/DIM1 with predicted DNA glycosylase/AP lyase activity
MASAIYSHIKGAPYVPTSNKLLKQIFSQIKINEGDYLIELGSGDGRATRYAVKELGVQGKGIDVNPFLIRWSNFLAKRQKLQHIDFIKEDVFKSDLKKADILYLFLMPEMLGKLRPKFEKELRKGSQIISHGFKVPGFDKKLVKTLTNKPFSTYYYKI